MFVVFVFTLCKELGKNEKHLKKKDSKKTKTMINIDSIDWEKLKLVKSGRTVKLMYDKKPLSFCTSTLYSPFGVKSVMKEWATFAEYSIDCSLNQSSNDSAVTFKAFLDELDKRVTQMVQDNLNVFNNPKSNVAIQSSIDYQPIMRENGSYPKLVRLQLNRDKNGNFTSFAFDESKNSIKIDEGNVADVLVKGKAFKAIIECSKLWFYNGKVGSIWNIEQLRFADSSKAKLNQVNQSMYTELMISD